MAKKTKKENNGLREKEKQFCEEYLIDFNGTQAAIRAGYSKKSAKNIASENLTKPDIQAYLAELKSERNERIQYSQDDVMKDLLEVKNRCMQKVPVMKYDKEEKCYIQEEDENGIGIWKFDAIGANSALDKLAKHTGFYELDNKQKTPQNPVIKVASESDKNLIEDL